MKLAILGTRGIPANYGGFETFAEELSWRLVERGHQVTVYCRSHHTESSRRWYRGVRLVVLPTLRYKYLDTVAHTFLSALHSLAKRFEAVLVCNAANAVFVPLIKLSGARVALNVDGLERKRKKWNKLGRWYYGFSERVACRVTDALISDAKVIQSYYLKRYRKRSQYIPYGAPTEKALTREALQRFGLQPLRYFLYVSRFEPENNAHLVLEAFREIACQQKLVMVGDAPYSRDYIARLKEMADERVVFTGYVFGMGYRELMSHAFCYIHATEVGGTHPALVEAMGMGNGLLVGDNPENREVAGEGAIFFSLSQAKDLAQKMRLVLDQPEKLHQLAGEAHRRAASIYNWEKVTDEYEALMRSLVKGESAEGGPEAGEDAEGQPT